MVKYRVNITDEALADMENLYSYMATTLQAPEGAMKQYNRIAKAILSLETFPERFALFENDPEHSLNIRRMIVDRYLVCYIVDADTVTVTNILYGASDVHKRLAAGAERSDAGLNPL